MSESAEKKVKNFIVSELSGWKTWEKILMASSALILISLSLHWGDNIIGIISATTGVLYVIFIGKGKISGYLFGLVNVCFYSFIAFNSKFYGEVMLNLLFYLPMQFVGWYTWNKNMNRITKEVNKRRLSLQLRMLVLIIMPWIIVGYGVILEYLGGNLPFIDSTTNCLSILAMIFTVGRFAEQWILWIVINMITIYMWGVDFINGGTDIATLIMWIVFLIVAVVMHLKWMKDTKLEKTSPNEI